MKKRMLRAGAVLLVFFVCALVIAPSFALCAHAGECEGADCPICANIEAMRRFAASPAICASSSSSPRLPEARGLLAARDSRALFLSPVECRVRMND